LPSRFYNLAKTPCGTSHNANILVTEQERGKSKLRIVTRRKLLEASRKHSGLADALESWYRIASGACWTSLQEVRLTYPQADGVAIGAKVFTVFHIRGNNFRLIVGINYRSQRVFIKHVLTHAEYDKGDWKK